MDVLTAGGGHGRSDAGPTEAVIRQVVKAFYDKVRVDEILGPVFEGIIGEHWDAHIEKVTSFWLYVTWLNRGYKSRHFIPAHIQHGAIKASLLPQWLRLFRATANELCTKEVADNLIDIAERMAVSVEMSLTRRDKEAEAKGLPDDSSKQLH